MTPLPIISLLLFSLLPGLPALPVLPNPDPASIQQQQQTFHPNSPSPPATIPSFPEQSAMEGCPVQLPDALFPAVGASCSHRPLRRDLCCPALAAWLYSAYSRTALSKRPASAVPSSTSSSSPSSPYDMPLLPDDSETCVTGLEKAMTSRGVNLARLNETCDVVYCYCGIRLHPLTCPLPLFSGSVDGALVGDAGLQRLERDCLDSRNNRTAHHTSNSGVLATCSKCLNSLYKLTKDESGNGNTTKSEARTSKMRSRDCELMGLTWLLNKNRDAYINTVTAVMRALMMNPEGSDPRSCSLSSDGMPLAVDSVEIDGQSSSVAMEFPLHLYLLSLFLLILSLNVLSH